MEPSTDPHSAVALVTGAASGIGLACAARYSQQGYTVVATDFEDRGAEAAAGIGVAYLPLDVADPVAWGDRVDRIRNDYGRLDLVHLNAGIRLGAADVAATPIDDYLRLIDTSQHGVFFGLRATVTLLAASGGGDVIVTASRAGLAPLPNDVPYAMAKHAVVALVRSAAPSLAEHRIRINAICPGTVDTGFLEGVGPEQLEAAGIAVMSPAEVADGVVAVLAAEATGTCFVQTKGVSPTPFVFGEFTR